MQPVSTAHASRTGGKRLPPRETVFYCIQLHSDIAAKCFGCKQTSYGSSTLCDAISVAIRHVTQNYTFLCTCVLLSVLKPLRQLNYAACGFPFSFSLYPLTKRPSSFPLLLFSKLSPFFLFVSYAVFMCYFLRLLIKHFYVWLKS